MLQHDLELVDFAALCPHHVCYGLILDLGIYVFSSFYCALYPPFCICNFGRNLFLRHCLEWFHLGTSVALLAWLLLLSRHNSSGSGLGFKLKFELDR
jgi:hypothetical protein